MKTKMLASALTIVLTAAMSSAQAENLLEIYQLALKGDPQLRAAAASRDASYQAKPIAEAGIKPSASLSSTGSMSLLHGTTGGVSAASNANGSLNATASVTQPIYRKANSLRIDQADSQIGQADADYSSAEQALVLRTAEAYFGVLSAQDDLQFAEAEKKAIARQLDQAQQRFEVGLIAITGVHEAQARFDSARASEISAINALGNAWEALTEIIAERPDALSRVQQEMALTDRKSVV